MSAKNLAWGANSVRVKSEDDTSDLENELENRNHDPQGFAKRLHAAQSNAPETFTKFDLQNIARVLATDSYGGICLCVGPDSENPLCGLDIGLPGTCHHVCVDGMAVFNDLFEEKERMPELDDAIKKYMNHKKFLKAKSVDIVQHGRRAGHKSGVRITGSKGGKGGKGEPEDNNQQVGRRRHGKGRN
jgi:hypothetical protein